MAEMRRIAYDSKIPGRTISKVSEIFETALIRQSGGRGLKLRGRKLPAEALTSVLVLHFANLPPAEQDRLVDTFLPLFERMTLEPEADATDGGAILPGPTRPKKSVERRRPGDEKKGRLA